MDESQVKMKQKFLQNQEMQTFLEEVDQSDKFMSSLPPEVEIGNIEYKLHLVSPNEYRYNRLVSQLKWRLNAGSNVALYELGVADNGIVIGLTIPNMISSLKTLNRMANHLNATTQIVNKTILKDGKVACEVLVQKRKRGERDSFESCDTDISSEYENENYQIVDEEYKDHVTLSLIGPTLAGKTSLLGVLTSGNLDNGKGRARLNLFTHRHEIESGKTSSISYDIIGFDSDNNLINYGVSGVMGSEEIIYRSSRVITFVDLAGDQKYLKTTITALSALNSFNSFHSMGNEQNQPNLPKEVPTDLTTLDDDLGGFEHNFVALVVGANMGVTPMAREHFEIAKALGVSLFVIITKVDACTPTQLQKTLTDLIALLSTTNKKIDLITNEQVLKTATNLFSTDKSNIPVFMISCVTGQNLELIKKFLATIKNPIPKIVQSSKDHMFYFQIEEVYTSVPDVGVVVFGTVINGVVSEGDEVLLGPDKNSNFSLLQIASIHRQRIPVSLAEAGHHITIAFSNFSIDPSTLRRGMVLLKNDPSTSKKVNVPSPLPVGSWKFEASITLLQHPSTLKQNFHGTAYVGSIRQRVNLLQLENQTDGTIIEELKKGESAIARFCFTQYPEYLKIGSTIFLREGQVKIVGSITRVIVE